MLKPRERSTVFWLFCIFTVALVALEVYLVYSMIAHGLTLGKGAMGVATGTTIYGIGKLFTKLISKTFLEPDAVISFTKLYRFASDRCRVLDQNVQNDDFATRQRLITRILQFAEELLRGWLPGSHFELCIFIDREQPLLFAYFDSNQVSTATSMQFRERDPYWYVEKKYEVLKVLNPPSSLPRIIQNTESKSSGYAFVSAQQRKQLRSTMLWCIDVGAPCAIVVSSDEKNAFRNSDPEVTAFVKFIGNLARFDLLENQFLHRIRDLRPDLFQNTTTGRA